MVLLWTTILLDAFIILFTWFGPQVDDFATNVTQGKANLYGFANETVDSMMLSLLPPIDHEYKRIPLRQNNVDEKIDIKVFLLKCLLDALRENAGFQIPKVCASSPIPELYVCVAGS